MATMTASLEQASKPRQRLGLWLLSLFLAVTLVAAWFWKFRQKSGAEANPNDVRWITPEARSIAASVTATGTVKLKTGAEVRVGAQLSGIVRRLNVTVGSHVHQGDIIAEIDARPTMAKIDQAKTQLAQAEVSRAKSQTDHARTQKLYEAGLVPAQQFDDAKAALDASKAAVASAQSGLAAAQVDLAYVEILAPISGTVASVSTQQGETVAASFATPTFMTIIQEGALEVIAMVDEADIGNVRRGQRVAFTTETYPDHEFQGTVTCSDDPVGRRQLRGRNLDRPRHRLAPPGHDRERQHPHLGTPRVAGSGEVHSPRWSAILGLSPNGSGDAGQAGRIRSGSRL